MTRKYLRIGRQLRFRNDKFWVTTKGGKEVIKSHQRQPFQSFQCWLELQKIPNIHKNPFQNNYILNNELINTWKKASCDDIANAGPTARKRQMNRLTPRLVRIL